METQVVYAETEVSGNSPFRTVISSGTATIEEVLDEADLIWADVREWLKLPEVEAAANDHDETTKITRAKLAELRGLHENFANQFPVALRWMVQLGEYSRKAFEKFVNRMSVAPPKTRNDFIEQQAEYLVMLYRASHVHYNEEYLRNYHTDILKQLKAEDTEFVEVAEQVDKDSKANQSAADAARRQFLLAAILRTKS